MLLINFLIEKAPIYKKSWLICIPFLFKKWVGDHIIYHRQE
jgi:hypothetical protein